MHDFVSADATDCVTVRQLTETSKCMPQAGTVHSTVRLLPVRRPVSPLHNVARPASENRTRSRHEQARTRQGHYRAARTGARINGSVPAAGSLLSGTPPATVLRPVGVPVDRRSKE